MKISRKWILLSLLPGLLAIGVFCSLALHVRLLGWQLSSIPLGYWPPALEIHFHVGSMFFIIVWFSLFVAPVAIVVCLVISRWRHVALYLGVHLLLCIAIVLLLQLAPESFVRWLTD
jgi:hypothetical protein